MRGADDHADHDHDHDHDHDLRVPDMRPRGVGLPPSQTGRNGGAAL